MVAAVFKGRSLDAWQILEAARLAAAGIPKAQIERQVGLSRRTINRLLDGELSTDDRREFDRCSGCGGKQLADQPCRVCRDRRALGRKRCA